MNMNTFNPHFAPLRAMARPYKLSGNIASMTRSYTLSSPKGLQSKPIIYELDVFA
jgi:hypothetical protein